MPPPPRFHTSADELTFTIVAEIIGQPSHHFKGLMEKDAGLELLIAQSHWCHGLSIQLLGILLPEYTVDLQTRRNLNSQDLGDCGNGCVTCQDVQVSVS